MATTALGSRRLGLLFLASAVLTLVGQSRMVTGPWLTYLFKPLTLLLLVAAVGAVAARERRRYSWAIAVGLAFSLAGDVFLMLPRDLFLAGLASFLLAHLAYLYAFTTDRRFLPRLLPALAMAAVAIGVTAYLWPSLGPALRLPVVLYVTALSAMAAQAIGRAQVLSTAAAHSAAWGAGLFVLSDALLAVNRFRHPFPGAGLAVLITYFAAQWLIARSALQPQP